MEQFYQEIHIPQAVLVDIGNAVETFFRDTSNMNDHEYGIDFTISQILMYIADFGVSDLGISAIGKDIRQTRELDPEFFEGENDVTATMNLARTLRDAFYHQGLYTKEGMLPYVFGGWLANQCRVLILRYSTKQH